MLQDLIASIFIVSCRMVDMGIVSEGAMHMMGMGAESLIAGCLLTPLES